MNIIIKILNKLLLAAIAILLIMSVLAIIAIHQIFFGDTYKFSFTPDGINTYLAAYGNYKALFASTVATMAAYFGLHRLKAATVANEEKVKQDRFSEWKTVLDIKLKNIEEKDPYMKTEFTAARYKLFERLYPLNFNIDNKEQLISIYNSIFLPMVAFFEQQNNKAIRMGAPYPHDKYSYSFDSFQYLFRGCLDKEYPGTMKDLQDLYVAALPSDRSIDPVGYSNALILYRTVI